MYILAHTVGEDRRRDRATVGVVIGHSFIAGTINCICMYTWGRRRERRRMEGGGIVSGVVWCGVVVCCCRGVEKTHLFAGHRKQIL